MNLNKFLIIPVALVGFFGQAQADSIRPMMMSALELGSHEGILTDAIADSFMAQTKSREPVRVSIKTIKNFEKRPECARLDILITQDGVLSTQGSKVPYKINFQMNLCPDGYPPEEGALPIGAPIPILGR